MFKKYAAALVCAMTLMSAAQAQAPVSQFGSGPWPYRQSTDCTAQEGVPTLSPEQPTNPPESGVCSPAGDTCVDAPATDMVGSPTRTPAPTSVPTPQPGFTQGPSTDDDYTTQSTSAQEGMMLKLLNQDRKNNGLPELVLDPALSDVARAKSCDMRDNRYFAHESPTYGRVAEMLRHFGYAFTAAGENIAHHATVEKAQAAFMSSDGHRRNILSSSWSRVGIGICTDADGFVYVTQIFVR